jgi:catechol 2,3-dioxygenase-like lactoylglutathione lyase family enzyme
MHSIRKLGYFTVGVADLDEAIEFYARFVRLDVTERMDRTAFMTGGIEHHWLRLVESPTRGIQRIGYEVESEEALAGIRDQLGTWGIAYEEGGDFRTDRVQRYLRFTDPGGFEIDLFTGMATRPVPPVSSGVAIEKFVHGGAHVKNWDETVRFYREVLGFKPSDWIGNMVAFLRCGDLYHHSLVLIRNPQEQSSFDHFCIQVESIDDVMRFRHNAVSHGVALRDDILRHGPSGSISVYIKDEARGFAVEYCTGHPRVDDEAHQARILPMVAESIDIWRSPLPEPRLAQPAPALDRLTGLDQPASNGGAAPARVS